MRTTYPSHRLPSILVALPLWLTFGAGPARAEGYAVFEPFTWSGAHAATIAAQTPAMMRGTEPHAHDCSPATAEGAHASTVWWRSDLWDARGDTPQVTTSASGYHVDVHRAVSANPADGREDNTVYALGGDGSPGVAAMRMDFQGIASARLRNPMLISAETPGVVGFWATKFLTTAHWWEIAITKSDEVIGAEHTAVPEVDDGLAGPFANSAGTPGPGHRPAEDSINLIGTGSADDPCNDGWSTRFAVTRSIGGATTDHFNPIDSLAELVQTDPSEVEELYQWQIEYRPNRIDLRADLDRDGTAELLETFAVDIPWREVHVHFMAVTYQADHHPQAPCHLGQVREFVWRNLSVEPVRYPRTTVHPREFGTTNMPRLTGWLAYDTRDIQRHGPPVNGVAQPNAGAFQTYASLLACNAVGSPFCPNATSNLQRSVALPADQIAVVRKAQLVYDIRSGLGDPDGVATLKVNGTTVGVLPPHATVPGADESEWVHRSLDIPVRLLKAGDNTVSIALANGFVELDRLQLELFLDGEPSFADGFESGGLGAWSAHFP